MSKTLNKGGNIKLIE